MKISIRKARLSDAHAVWQINRDNWQHVFQDIYSKERIERTIKKRPPEKDEEKFRKGIKKGYIYYVAVSGKKVVGMLIYIRKKKIINIRSLYIDIHYHGKGIGTALMKFVEKKEKSKTYTVTSANRKQTMTFYEKMGYRKLRTTKTKEGDIDVIMIKRIKK
jgi:ribosomal protein S18 acetylase RimI-like enzyme